jgi:hypothetical protein
MPLDTPGWRWPLPSQCRATEPHLAVAAGRYAVIGLLALVGGCVFWLWAQVQPLTRLFEAFFMASGFNWGNPRSSWARRSGRRCQALPRRPGSRSQCRSDLGMAFAAVRVALPTLTRRLRPGLLLFPAIAAMVRHLSLYDGIRHMLFIVVPMAVLGAAGWDFLFRAVPRKTLALAAGAFAVMIAEPFLFQVRNHPNQAVYFTPMAAGPAPSAATI